MTLTLDENHVYCDIETGRAIPGVTSVLKEYMTVNVFGEDYSLHIPSGAIIPVAIMKRAAAFGTAFHDGARLMLTGQGLDWNALDEALAPALLQLKWWIAENVAEVLVVEQPMHSARYDYAGTPDLICRLKQSKKGHRCLIDFKTGLYGAAARAQTAAYEQLYRENYKYKGFMDRAILHISKDGEKVELVPMTGKTDFQYFLNKLECYRWEQALR